MVRDVFVPRPHGVRTPLRRWMVPVSFAVHVAAIGVTFVVSVFATTTLPSPPQSTIFQVALRADPPPPPPPPRAPRAVEPPATAAAPVSAPDRIAPDPGLAIDAGPELRTVVGVGSVDGLGAQGVSAELPPPPTPPLPGPATVRAGVEVRPPEKTAHVDPIYPPLALQANVSGYVILETVIDTSGRVGSVRVLRASSPLLETAAVDAVRQWRYTPTTVGGRPVSVTMTVTVHFTLRR